VVEDLHFIRLENLVIDPVMIQSNLVVRKYMEVKQRSFKDASLEEFIDDVVRVVQSRAVGDAAVMFTTRIAKVNLASKCCFVQMKSS